MNRQPFSKKRIVGSIIAIILALCFVCSFFISVDFSANNYDLRCYQISGCLFFLVFEIGLLLELNFFNLGSKIPLLKTSSIFKHLLFWIIIGTIAFIMFSIPYSMTSTDFREQLSKNSEDIEYENSLSLEESSKESSSISETVNSECNIGIISETSQTIDENAETQENNIESSNFYITEEHGDDIESDGFLSITWEDLSYDKDRYKHILTLLGENFNKGIYVVEDFIDLTPEEQLMVKNLYDYADDYSSLPSDFTMAFTSFCVGPEYENLIIETYSNPFYSALSNSFIISWKSDGSYYINIKDINSDPSDNNKEDSGIFVSEENPLSLLFDEQKHIVGNCSVILRKIEIVSVLHKVNGDSSTYANYIRIHATVINNSLSETNFMSVKPGSFFIGKYYGTNQTEYIGWNDNYKWKVDLEIKTDYSWILQPNQIKDIYTSGVFISTNRLQYDNIPIIDLYFANNDEILTLSIND